MRTEIDEDGEEPTPSVGVTQAPTAPVCMESNLACKHQQNVLLEKTDSWSFINLDAPQAQLFDGAAGARPVLVRQGLANGASPRLVLLYTWPGVTEGGEVTQNPEAGPAFRWRGHRGAEGYWADVELPLEAAIAGGSPDCIRLLTEAGADWLAACKWLHGLPLAVPRVEAGLTLLALCNPRDPNERVACQRGIERVIYWLDRDWPRDEFYTRILNAHRHLARVSEPYGIKYRPPKSALAAML